MKTLHRTLVLSAAAAALSPWLAIPGLTQEIDLSEIVVTPNRTPMEKSKVGSTVSTIDQKEIEQQSLPLVVDYLNQVPGISLSSQGGAGKETTLILRGADKKYIKTLFNGIDISDPTATQVQTSYEHLLTGGITRIEVLKGSQSTLYGSDAVAGVIDISTLPQDQPGLTQRMMIEGGSYETGRAAYGVSNVTDTGRFALDIAGLYTGGFSAALVNGDPLVDSSSGLEDDFYQNVTGSFAGEQQLTDNVSIFGSGLIIRTRGDFDDSGTPPTDNTLNTGDFNQIAGRAGFNVDLMDGRFRNTFSAQVMRLDRSVESSSVLTDFMTGLPSRSDFIGNYEGQRVKFDYQGAFDVTDRLTLQFGSDYEQQALHITNNFGTDDNDSAALTGVWGQVVAEPIDNFTLTAGLRHDEHSEFGGFTTYRGTAAYLFDQTGTKLRASVGTGFRAPSLYENNYVSFIPGIPVPDLDPEESFSWDVGIDQRLFDGRATGSLTYFELDTDNLIDYDFANDTYMQTPGTTHRKGVELALAYDVNPWLSLGGSYTYTSSVEADGDRRPRVPRHMIGLTAVATPWERWEISAAAKIALDTVDVVQVGTDPVTFAPITELHDIDDYVLASLRVAYKPTKNSELYVRAENLFDQDYETVRGYGTPGFSVFAGFRAKIGG